MRSFRVLSALHNPASGHLEVVREITDDDGSTSLNLHTIHPETLEWRAAEYDIDDVDELVELLLHEGFIEDVQPLQIPLEEARLKVRARISEASSRLTSSKAKNKEEHKNRLRAAGVDDRYVAAADEDPYDVIKRHCAFDQVVIDVKREHIARVRRNIEAERATPPPRPSGVERAAALREALNSNTGRVTAPHESAAQEHAGKLKTVALDGRVRKNR